MSRSVFGIDFRGMSDLERRLGRYQAKAPGLLRKAFNTTGRKTKKRIIERVRETLNIKAKSVNSRVDFKAAKMQGGGLTATVRVHEKKGPPNLMSYLGTRWSYRRGVAFRILRGGALQHAEHAFIGAAKGGHSHDIETGQKIVMERKVVNGYRLPDPPLGRPHRHKMALFGRSPVALLLHEPGFADEQQTFMADTLKKEVDAVISKELADRKR